MSKWLVESIEWTSAVVGLSYVKIKFSKIEAFVFRATWVKCNGLKVKYVNEPIVISEVFVNRGYWHIFTTEGRKNRGGYNTKYF
jgi:hypothetical protein